MDEPLHITTDERPAETDRKDLIRKLVAHNEAAAGPERHEPLAVFARRGGPGGEIVGGAEGYTHWGWLFVSHLWVHESLRGQDLGTRLLANIEEAARRRGAVAVYLDTYSFQARGFYEKRGYTLFGELPDYPALARPGAAETGVPSGKKFFLWKRLV